MRRCLHLRSLRLLTLLLSACAFVAICRQSNSTDQKAQQKRRTPEPLWQKLLRVSGVSATPGTQRGPGDEMKAGQIWIADLDNSRTYRIANGSFRWPVFASDGRAVLALNGNRVSRISLDNTKRDDLLTVTAIYKLVGCDDAGQLLVLFMNQSRYSPAYLSISSGQLSTIPFDPNSAEDEAALASLKASERVYGSKRVYVKSQTKEDVGGTVEWTDVYLRTGDATGVNVSQCNGTNCGQPSLSPDQRLVTFIKAEPQ